MTPSRMSFAGSTRGPCYDCFLANRFRHGAGVLLCGTRVTESYPRDSACRIGEKKEGALLRGGTVQDSRNTEAKNRRLNRQSRPPLSSRVLRVPGLHPLTTVDTFVYANSCWSVLSTVDNTVQHNPRDWLRISCKPRGKERSTPESLKSTFGRTCFVTCALALSLYFQGPCCNILGLSPLVASAENLLYKGPGEKEAIISAIGRCSGSAMVCEAPGAQSKKYDSSGLGAGALDSEHAFFREVLEIIDRYYYDLKNEQGAAASAQAHTYNGNALADMSATIDARKLPSRDATYKEIRQIIRRLDDKYSRFLGYLCTSKASKLRICYLALYQPRHTVGYTCGSPSLFNSLRPYLNLDIGTLPP